MGRARPAGLEPATSGLESPSRARSRAPMREKHAGEHVEERERTGRPTLGGPGEEDPVELALADALRRAAAASAWDAVQALTSELRARREGKAGVVSR